MLKITKKDYIDNLTRLTYINQLPDPMSLTRPIFFTTSSNIPFGDYILLIYTKGIIIPTANDAILIAVDYQGNRYSAFCNTGEWKAFRKT